MKVFPDVSGKISKAIKIKNPSATPNSLPFMLQAQSKPRKAKKNPKRIDRVAKGSGSSEKEVREFLSQFEKMEKMMGKFKKDRGFRKKLEKMMQGGGLQGMGM